MKKLLLFIFAGIAACNPEDVTQKIDISGNGDIKVGFTSLVQSIDEGEQQDVYLSFSKTTTASGFIEIVYASDNATFDVDFMVTPSPVDGVVRLDFSENADSVSFTVETSANDEHENKEIQFTILDTSENIIFDSQDSYTLAVQDTTDSSIPDDELLTVVTWNVEYFPLDGTTTVNAVRDIILAMDADVIAFQEIDDTDAFESLDAALTDWEGQWYDVRYGIELAYLYKTSEINSISSLSAIFPDDSEPFPRQPVLTTITHKNGLEVTLIDLHLKCCDDGELRRKDASELLKTYMDENMVDENVIVLGDYNDDILSGSPFSNFIADADNYMFTDMDIANGSSSYWSYPSWPSHLDHIMITNELFDNFLESETLRLDLTLSNYLTSVSDHRPVAATFKN